MYGGERRAAQSARDRRVLRRAVLSPADRVWEGPFAGPAADFSAGPSQGDACPALQRCAWSTAERLDYVHRYTPASLDERPNRVDPFLGDFEPETLMRLPVEK